MMGKGRSALRGHGQALSYVYSRATIYNIRFARTRNWSWSKPGVVPTTASRLSVNLLVLTSGVACNQLGRSSLLAFASVYALPWNEVASLDLVHQAKVALHRSAMGLMAIPWSARYSSNTGNRFLFRARLIQE